MRTQRVRPREPAETTPQTAKRPQGENYKFATKSPPTFVPQTKDKRDETNPDSTLLAAPHGPLRTGQTALTVPLRQAPLSDSNAEDFEIRDIFVTFARLSLTFPYFFISNISKENESPSSLPTVAFLVRRSLQTHARPEHPPSPSARRSPAARRDGTGAGAPHDA